MARKHTFNNSQLIEMAVAKARAEEARERLAAERREQEQKKEEKKDA